MQEWQILDANERFETWMREHPAEMRIIARQSAEIVRRINEEDNQHPDFGNGLRKRKSKPHKDNTR